MTGAGRSPARASNARGHPQREGLPLLEERAGGEEFVAGDLTENTLTVPNARKRPRFKLLSVPRGDILIYAKRGTATSGAI